MVLSCVLGFMPSFDVKNIGRFNQHTSFSELFYTYFKT